MQILNLYCIPNRNTVELMNLILVVRGWLKCICIGSVDRNGYG